MTPGTNPAGRTPLGVRTGGAARGTNEPPSRFYRNRPLLGSDKHVALLPRLGWRNTTRRFFRHNARASASRWKKNELFRWVTGTSHSAVLPSTAALQQEYLHARLARAHALCSMGEGRHPLGPAA